MHRRHAFRALAALVCLGALVAVAGVTWRLALGAALDRLELRGRADLSLAADRLVSQLQQYRELAVLLADRPEVAAVLRGETAGAAALLLRAADKTGSRGIAVLDAGGRVRAASQPGAAPAAAAGTPAFARAMGGALGTAMSGEGGAMGRTFTFHAPVHGDAARPIGAVAVQVSVWAVETNWRGDPQAVFFTDPAGTIFVSNRTELLFRSRAAPGAASEAHGAAALRPFIDHASVRRAGHAIWRIDAGRYLPARALYLTQPLPVIGMTGAILVDAAPAFRLAGQQAAAATAALLAVAAMLFLVSVRRRALADRLAIEAAANARLEARVARRTAELERANADLRREIGEREEAEAALKRAQADLVQAGKLSALGQMSAGLSHELNQPLMAIRSFAENAEALLDRGRTGDARGNLGRIVEMARRMGRIIGNLRAFARQERAPVADVDMGGVVDAALDIAGPHAARAGVRVAWERPAEPVMVRGGEVRLSQVVVNLLTNAVEAMEGVAEKRLEIALRPGATVRLSVRDTGPGIADPGRIFDPFYSTKEVGGAEGMGLGLSISYGLAQSFGGAIRGCNHPEGGAVFEVELTPAAGVRAA